ncbi:MAG: long-chain fatty acid--CoA ligase [Ruminococcaceae bacterium]|nr:long-chain fatty acid--CoA ligase [Oscillospiraceae bacterium]
MYKNRKKNYPYYEVRPCDSIRMLVDSSANLFADKDAFRYRKDGSDRSVKYSEFKIQVDCLGTALYSLGIGKSHISVIGDNCYPWVLSYVTCLISEAVVTPIDKELSTEEIANILVHSECEAIFFTNSVSKKIEEIKSSLDCIKTFILMDGVASSVGDVKNVDELLQHGQRLLEEGDTRFMDVVPDMYGLKQLVYTSGTTGKSKGVMLSQDTLCFNVVKSQELMNITERALSVLPYNHCYEATCGLLTMLHHGMTICINESLRTILPNFKKYKPTEMQIVPLYAENFYRRIKATIEDKGLTKKFEKGIKISNLLLKIGIDKRRSMFKDIHETFGGELVSFICGGAPLKSHITEFFESIGIVMINGYGITECGPLISINRPEYYNFASVGLPLKDTIVKIYEPNEDGEGEIIVKGRNVMLGYYKNPEATKAVIIDGFFHTGDVGKIDKDGFVYITGRKKNLIVLKNGKNIYPEEIEEQLMDIPFISEVVVFSAKAADLNGKALGAEIYPSYEYASSQGVENVEDEIKKAIGEFNKKQPPYRVIKQLVFRDTEFEKTTTKKIKRTYDAKAE